MFFFQIVNTDRLINKVYIPRWLVPVNILAHLVASFEHVQLESGIVLLELLGLKKNAL